MQRIFGSHWHWRLLFLLVLGLVLAGTWRTAPLRSVATIPGSGSRIITKLSTRDRTTIQALDPATQRQWDVFHFQLGHDLDSLRVVREGKTIAWIENFKMRSVDVDVPHQVKSYPLPDEVARSAVVGISSDERFVVFQEYAHLSDGGYWLRVVDRTTNKTIPRTLSASGIEATGNPNEFRSVRLKYDVVTAEQPFAALWRLTSTGKLEPVSSKSQHSFSRFQEVRIAQSPEGAVRLLDERDAPTSSESETSGTVVTVAPTGHVLIRTLVQDPILVWDPSSRELRRTDFHFGNIDVVFPEEGYIATASRWDDIHVVDLKTATTVARFGSGSYRRRLLIGFAILTAVLAAAWVWVGAREESWWWVFDTAAAVAVIPLVSLLLLMARFSLWEVSPPGTLTIEHLGFTAGILAGASIVTGWYWAFGRGKAVMQWFRGGLWLSVLSVYLSQRLMNKELGFDEVYLPSMDVAWSFSQSASIVVAGLMALALLMLKGSGWSLSNIPRCESSRQFGLSSLFIAMMGFAMLIAVLNSVPITAHRDGVALAVLPGLATALFGGLLFSSIVSRSKSSTGIQLAVLMLLLLPSTWGAGVGFLALRGLMPPDSIWLTGGFLVGVALPIAIASSLARCHGWRWMREADASELTPENGAARETIESAPQKADFSNQPILN